MTRSSPGIGFMLVEGLHPERPGQPLQRDVQALGLWFGLWVVFLIGLPLEIIEVLHSDSLLGLGTG